MNHFPVTRKNCLLAALTLLILLPSGFPAAAQDGEWWKPSKTETTWNIQLKEPPTPDSVPEKLNILVADLFAMPVAAIQTLQARKVRVVCYVNAGVWEEKRLDAGLFPADLLGAAYDKKYGLHKNDGWKWLDIRQAKLRPLIESRLDLCRDMGFDGVMVDNVNGFENATGFSLTAEDQKTYNLWLAQAAHQRGLGIGLTNTTSLAAELAPHYDWIVTEDCVAQRWCSETSPFLDLNKPVFAIEYPMLTLVNPKTVCPTKMAGVNLLFKPLDLGAQSIACPAAKE